MKTKFFFFTTKIDLNKINGNKTLWIFLIQKKLRSYFILFLETTLRS